VVRLLVLIFSMSVFSVQAELDISKFSDHDKYRDVKISPTGKYLAISRFINGESDLLVVDSQTMKAVNQIALKGKDEVGIFYWANDERLVIQIYAKEYSKEFPVYYGELFAIDATKRKGKLIFGSRFLWQRPKKIKDKKIWETHKAMASSWASIIDILPNDPEHILISARPYSKDKKKTPRIYKLNIYDAGIKFITEMPLPFSRIFTGVQGEMLLATGKNKKGKKIIYSYDKNKNVWMEIDNLDLKNLFVSLIYKSESHTLITLDDAKNKTRTLNSLNLKTGEKTLLFNDSDIDIGWVHLSEDKKRIYGITTEPGYPQYHFPGIDLQEEAFYKTLVEGFKGYRVKISSNTKDLNQFVFSIASDREPQSWYLFDRKKNKASFIAKRNDRINPDKMRPMHAFDFNARDGQNISGYLTLPAGDKTDQLPAVVLVHRDPFGVRDIWEYNHEVQLLAAKGYLVLQVNYRGSGGYGNKFKDAGYGHWGDTIQHDILDGLEYLVSQNIIDTERVCIMGFDFGGYSAVQASIIAPKQFKCAIAASGVYDLEEEFGTKHIDDYHHGKSYYKKVSGELEKLKDFSPINFINKLETPILLVHGGKDTHTSIEQAKQLKNKLDELGKVYVWMNMKNEGYGIYNEKNRLKYYTNVIEFLDQYNPVK